MSPRKQIHVLMRNDSPLCAFEDKSDAELERHKQKGDSPINHFYVLSVAYYRRLREPTKRRKRRVR